MFSPFLKITHLEFCHSMNAHIEFDTRKSLKFVSFQLSILEFMCNFYQVGSFSQKGRGFLLFIIYFCIDGV